jgi:hypothetical protein
VTNKREMFYGLYKDEKKFFIILELKNGSFRYFKLKNK